MRTYHNLYSQTENDPYYPHSYNFIANHLSVPHPSSTSLTRTEILSHAQNVLTTASDGCSILERPIFVVGVRDGPRRAPLRIVPLFGLDRYPVSLVPWRQSPWDGQFFCFCGEGREKDGKRGIPDTVLFRHEWLERRRVIISSHGPSRRSVHRTSHNRSVWIPTACLIPACLLPPLLRASAISPADTITAVTQLAQHLNLSLEEGVTASFLEWLRVLSTATTMDSRQVTLVRLPVVSAEVVDEAFCVRRKAVAWELTQSCFEEEEEEVKEKKKPLPSVAPKVVSSGTMTAKTNETNSGSKRPQVIATDGTEKILVKDHVINLDPSLHPALKKLLKCNVKIVLKKKKHGTSPKKTTKEEPHKKPSLVLAPTFRQDSRYGFEEMDEEEEEKAAKVSTSLVTKEVRVSTYGGSDGDDKEKSLPSAMKEEERNQGGPAMYPQVAAALLFSIDTSPPGSYMIAAETQSVVPAIIKKDHSTSTTEDLAAVAAVTATAVAATVAARTLDRKNTPSGETDATVMNPPKVIYPSPLTVVATCSTDGNGDESGVAKDAATASVAVRVTKQQFDRQDTSGNETNATVMAAPTVIYEDHTKTELATHREDAKKAVGKGTNSKVATATTHLVNRTTVSNDEDENGNEEDGDDENDDANGAAKVKSSLAQDHHSHRTSADAIVTPVLLDSINTSSSQEEENKSFVTPPNDTSSSKEIQLSQHLEKTPLRKTNSSRSQKQESVPVVASLKTPPGGIVTPQPDAKTIGQRDPDGVAVVTEGVAATVMVKSVTPFADNDEENGNGHFTVETSKDNEEEDFHDAVSSTVTVSTLSQPDSPSSPLAIPNLKSSKTVIVSDLSSQQPMVDNANDDRVDNEQNKIHGLRDRGSRPSPRPRQSRAISSSQITRTSRPSLPSKKNRSLSSSQIIPPPPYVSLPSNRTHLSIPSFSDISQRLSSFDSMERSMLQRRQMRNISVTDIENAIEQGDWEAVVNSVKKKDSEGVELSPVQMKTADMVGEIEWSSHADRDGDSFWGTE